jgi:hypothetical protein
MARTFETAKRWETVVRRGQFRREALSVNQHLAPLHSSSNREASNNCKTALDATREAIRNNNWRCLREINLNEIGLFKV